MTCLHVIACGARQDVFSSLHGLLAFAARGCPALTKLMLWPRPNSPAAPSLMPRDDALEPARSRLREATFALPRTLTTLDLSELNYDLAGVV